MARRAHRIDNFEGTDSEYIEYLESHITYFRSYVHASSKSQQHGSVALPFPQTKPGQKSSNDKLLEPPTLPELDIIAWNPGRISVNTKNSAAVALPDRVKSFLREIPRTEEEWKEKRQSLDLATPDGLFRAFDELMLAGPTWAMDKCSQANGVQGSLVQYAQRLGIITHEVHRLRKMSTFGKLIFVAACCVAIETKHPSGMVDDAMRLCLASTSSTKTLGRYRRTALYTIQQMDELYPELNHRAFEIFLHGNVMFLWFQ
ncbi:hypothetical protein PG985_005650 [Apiospora marii]|uniref:uncharacterized protein n=1 Tax=Apiospora marii TaxID=335849 RepID=UPI00312F3C00